MTAETQRVCLVTGALGFLGRRVVREFAREGYRVVGLGRDQAPADAVPGLASYISAELPGCEFVEQLVAERPTVIVHAAGPASVAASINDPAGDFRGTVDVLMGVLEAVREHAPDAAVVILSSAAVYGNPVTLPVSESATISPVSPYGFHKQIAETLIAEYHTVYGLRTAAARVFSAYGSGLRRQVLWDVCEKATRGSLQLFGTGLETRDFVHADDVARAVRVIAEEAAFEGETYNVASGNETSIEWLAHALVARVAPEADVRFTEVSRPGDPLRWRADISRLAGLGYEPCVDLDTGIDDYCNWYLGLRGRS